MRDIIVNTYCIKFVHGFIFSKLAGGRRTSAAVAAGLTWLASGGPKRGTKILETQEEMKS